MFNDKEIERILKKLEPKIKKSLKETNVDYRDDLEQDLIKLIIETLKSNTLQDVPDFFDVINKHWAPED